MEAYLVCCLCSYRAPDESNLEVHIDSDHSDIFRSALNLSGIKIEDVPITQVYQAPPVYQESSVYQTLPQVQSTSYQNAAQALSTPYQVTPQTNQQFYQQQYSEQVSSMSHEYPSQTYTNEVPAQVTPKVGDKQESDVNTKCPYCPYSNSRSKILQNHINKKHPDEQNANGQILSESLPPPTNVTPAVAKNSRKRQSLPSDLTTIHSKIMQSAKRGKNHGSETTFINMDEKSNAQVVAQQSMESNIETLVQSHSGKRSKKQESDSYIKIEETYHDAPSNPQVVAQQSMESDIETPVQNKFSKRGKKPELATFNKMEEKFSKYPTNTQVVAQQSIGSPIETIGNL